MTQSGFFRRAMLGGFNQDDVLEYIDEQQKQLDTLREENAQFYEEYKSLYDKYERDKATVSQAFEKLKAVTVAYQGKVAETERLAEEVEQLKSRVLDIQSGGSSDDSGSSLSQTSKIFSFTPQAPLFPGPDEQTDISQEIGTLLIEAKHTADNLIERAKGEVNDIKSQSLVHAKKSISMLESTKNQLELLKSRMEDVFSRFSDNLDGMSRTLEDVKSTVEEEEKALPKPLKNPSDLKITDENLAAFSQLQSEIQEVIDNLDRSQMDSIKSQHDFGMFRGKELSNG